MFRLTTLEIEMRDIALFIAAMTTNLLASAASAGITKDMIVDAQKEWGNGIVAIGKAKVEGENYKDIAKKHIDSLYDYDKGKVLFKPTKAHDDQFRENFEQAHSYFVKGKLKEDGGFAIHPWTAVRFENHDMFIYDNIAMAMGNYYFTTVGGDEVKVEYTFGYRLEGDDLKIVLHHSSLPYNK